jgi:hypothetical protein
MERKEKGVHAETQRRRRGAETVHRRRGRRLIHTKAQSHKEEVLGRNQSLALCAFVPLREKDLKAAARRDGLSASFASVRSLCEPLLLSLA